MHLLTWVGFGLRGYVPNTLYNIHDLVEYHIINISIAAMRSRVGSSGINLSSPHDTHTYTDTPRFIPEGVAETSHPISSDIPPRHPYVTKMT
jgi:hypothetical protein